MRVAWEGAVSTFPHRRVARRLHAPQSRKPAWKFALVGCVILRVIRQYEVPGISVRLVCIGKELKISC